MIFARAYLTVTGAFRPADAESETVLGCGRAQLLKKRGNVLVESGDLVHVENPYGVMIPHGTLLRLNHARAGETPYHPYMIDAAYPRYD